MDIVTGSLEIPVMTVVLRGRLDALEAGSVREVLDAALADGQSNLVVDLRDVGFVDSAGLAALVKAMKDARLVGGDVKLVAPRSEEAMRIFELTRFDQVFTMADEIETIVEGW